MSRLSSISSQQNLRVSLFSQRRLALNIRQGSQGSIYRSSDRTSQLTEDRNSASRGSFSRDKVQLGNEDLNCLLAERDALSEYKSYSTLHVSNLERELSNISHKYQRDFRDMQNHIDSLEASVKHITLEKDSFRELYYSEREKNSGLYMALQSKEDLCEKEHKFGYYSKMKEKLRAQKEKYTDKIKFSELNSRKNNNELNDKNNEIARLKERIGKLNRQIDSYRNEHLKYEKLVTESSDNTKTIFNHINQKIKVQEDKVYELFGIVRKFEGSKNDTISQVEKKIDEKNKTLSAYRESLGEKDLKIELLKSEIEDLKQKGKDYEENERILRLEIQNTKSIHENFKTLMDSKIVILQEEIERLNILSKDTENTAQSHKQRLDDLDLAMKEQYLMSLEDISCPRLSEFLQKIQNLSENQANLLANLESSALQIHDLKSELNLTQSEIQGKYQLEISSLSNQTKDLKHELSQKVSEAAALSLEKSKMLEKLDSMSRTYQRTLTDSQTTEDSLQDLQNHIQSVLADFQDSSQDPKQKLSNFKSQFQAYSDIIKATNEELDSLKEQNSKLYETCQTLDSNVKESYTILEYYQQQNLSEKRDLESARQLSNKKDEIIGELQIECAKLSSQNEEYMGKCAVLEQQCYEVYSKNQILMQTAEEHSKDIEKKDSEIQNIQLECAQKNAQSSDLSQKARTFEDLYVDLHEKYTTVLQDFNCLQEQFEGISAENEELRGKSEDSMRKEYEDQVSRLQESFELSKETYKEQLSMIDKQLVELKHSNKLLLKEVENTTVVKNREIQELKAQLDKDPYIKRIEFLESELSKFRKGNNDNDVLK